MFAKLTKSSDQAVPFDAPLAFIIACLIKLAQNGDGRRYVRPKPRRKPAKKGTSPGLASNRNAKNERPAPVGARFFGLSQTLARSRYHDSVVRRRIAFAAAALSFLILLALVVWQGSFSFSYTPSDLRETVVLWAVSTLIFVLLVALAFLLFRTIVKLYIDRQSNKEGSRIRSRLFIGALSLALVPVLLFVYFSIYLLNRTLDKWFTQPVLNVRDKLQQVDTSFRQETKARAQTEADWVSLLPQLRDAAQTRTLDRRFFETVCATHHLSQLTFTLPADRSLPLCQNATSLEHPLFKAASDVMDGPFKIGRVEVVIAMSVDLATELSTIQRVIDEQTRLKVEKNTFRFAYILLDSVITLFVLFFAAWSAQILSRQISIPISALLEAAREVRQGNLSFRVRVNAIDELATLVRAFNEMTNELETNALELEARRQFTEAILESIPTGVISVSAGERIERVNRAMYGIFPRDVVVNARQLKDLFCPEDLAEIRYIMKRARRTGAAASQLEVVGRSAVLHLAVTAASLEEHRGFVLVLEDTSELLRAQKSAAWQEVARRIAHEIKNPLTPISLCADRIGRQLLRISLPAESRAILDECTQTIQQEVQTVKSLVDEFSQFSRFPAAQPVTADLNEIVESAMTVFAGRLENIAVTVDLDPHIPFVLADREQIRRVIVNLVDNAAEAMSDVPVRAILVSTSQMSTDFVELSVSDTGCGVSAEDKEKLFLPYFSTKNRGTGLGLAIVNHIVKEHRGRVRVEDNRPAGTRFVVELNTVTSVEAALTPDIVDAAPAENAPATLNV